MKPTILFQPSACCKRYASKVLWFLILLTVELLTCPSSFSQCAILDTAVQGITYTYVQPGGFNASGVAYNPNLDIYYTVIAGNPGFPYETFDASGTSLYQTLTGFDFRGLWWNPNVGEVEGNGFNVFGLWTSDLDANGYALSSGTNLFTGQHQPDIQSCGDYDYNANEIIYYYNGSIFRFDRATDQFISSYPLTGSPVPFSNINSTSVIYTGCCGNEIGIEDYVNNTILLFNKATGAYSGTSILPAGAITTSAFWLSYANNMVWLYDSNTRTWTSYSIFSGAPGSMTVNLGNDTSLCIGSTMVLHAGSAPFQYAWSTGATDSLITIDTAGVYWVNVTDGNCSFSDTIIIVDTLCSSLVVFQSSDTVVCEKYCINFTDSSANNPIAWQWFFEGASPTTSTDQNPTNICYNDSGTYNVTLITTSITGNDTLVLTDYITVYPTPPIPTIIQNGYLLTASPGSAYQWQFNSIDIPGATNQSYTATQTGLYSVFVYDAHGCRNSTGVEVNISGISNVNSDVMVSVFPNPNSGSFMVEVLNIRGLETLAIEVENAIGQMVYSSLEQVSTSSWKAEINLHDASAGIYFIEVKAGESFWRSKVLIEK